MSVQMPQRTYVPTQRNLESQALASGSSWLNNLVCESQERQPAERIAAVSE